MVQHDNYWWLFGQPSNAMRVKIFIINIIIIIIIIGSTSLGGSWPTRANVASELRPVHPPANFYSPVFLCLPLPHQSSLISVGHILVDLQGLSIISFLGNSFSSICTVYWILLQ
jgi:hypothetical protein